MLNVIESIKYSRDTLFNLMSRLDCTRQRQNASSEIKISCIASGECGIGCCV